MNPHYDYVIVGAGLTGSVLAERLHSSGKSVIVIDKNPEPGGNVRDHLHPDGYYIHDHGPHIFHAHKKWIWDYLQRFTTFIPYFHQARSWVSGSLYTIPINLQTIREVYPDIEGPKDAEELIARITASPPDGDHLEAHCISMIGETLYRLLIEGYTEKQWGTHPTELPKSIIARLPVRASTFNDHYHFSPYSGIPNQGYTNMVRALLDNVDTVYNTDYFENREYWETRGNKLVYTGSIDEYWGYQYGLLGYRSMQFTHKAFDSLQQGCACYAYPEKSVTYTRSTEHAHFYGMNPKESVVTYEHSREWEPGMDRHYPLLHGDHRERYNQYRALKTDTIFAGRLGSYQYLDMHQAVAQAFTLAEKLSGVKQHVHV